MVNEEDYSEYDLPQDEEVSEVTPEDGDEDDQDTFTKGADGLLDVGDDEEVDSDLDEEERIED